MGFLDGFIGEIKVRNGHMKLDDAISLLKKAYTRKAAEIENDQIQIIGESPSQSNSQARNESSNSRPSSSQSQDCDEAAQCMNFSNVRSSQTPPKKRKRDMFSRIRELEMAAGVKEQQHDEVERYIRLGLLDSKKNPLMFWKESSALFPVLSKLAQQYLSMPATSASVERLFSVAGAIISSRRASMKIETAEQLILYREYTRKDRINSSVKDF